ncbi:MAG: efflux RND transporter periplasmic adaptor subunit [Phycisphaerales bacterium]|nr:MAG: efflux RND transporter periplasmic adaptor subunit [Phycisphaerales bacterium]
MSTKMNDSSGSAARKINNAGIALFAFVVLAGLILWLTGNLHFGPRAAETHEGDADHMHAHEDVSDADLCQEHGVPELVCTRCNPSLIAAFKARGDWCGEHGLPESQCALCNPNLQNARAKSGIAEDSLDSLAQAVCEHEVRTVECDLCRYEVGVVKLQPAVADALVETFLVQTMAPTKSLSLTGEVQLDQTRVVEVVPTGSGQVRRVEKLLGQDVSAGDTLAIIHSADLGQAKAQFLEVEATLELATSTLEREKGLYERKISSKADYLSASNELKAAQAYYAAAEKRLRLFGLTSKQIEGVKNERENGQFAELVLRAPQSGTIIAQNVSVGAMVDATESLFTIADLTKVWVWCDLYEKDLAILQDPPLAGERVVAHVRVNAFKTQVLDGVVDLIGSQVDQKTRTVKIRIQVSNESLRLRPGMFAEAEIIVPLGRTITVVPSSAILSDEGSSFVFQRWKDDLWVRRNVLVGEDQGDFVEVRAGIAKGAEVVSSGGFLFKSEVLKEKMGAGCAH